MDHTYFLVSLNLDSRQTLWGHELSRMWKRFVSDHSLMGDPKRLILTDEELNTLSKYDSLGFLVEEFDSNLTNTLWRDYGDDEGGPARLSKRCLLDKNRLGDWKVFESGT